MIDINKKYRTRDGKEVKSLKLRESAKSLYYPIQAIVMYGNGEHHTHYYTSEGFYYSIREEDELDLIEVEQAKPECQLTSFAEAINGERQYDAHIELTVTYLPTGDKRVYYLQPDHYAPESIVYRINDAAQDGRTFQINTQDDNFFTIGAEVVKNSIIEARKI